MDEINLYANDNDMGMDSLRNSYAHSNPRKRKWIKGKGANNNHIFAIN